MIQINSPLGRIRFVACKNTSGEAIPAFAVMRVTGVTDEVLQVAKPNAASDTKAVVNGPTPIPIAGFGNATYDSPFFVLYETADGTPTFGDMWGTESGSWKLRAANDGFCALGGAVAGHAWFSSGGSMGGGTGTLTVEEVDGSPSVANVATLRFDQVDGFVVSTTGAGVARVDMAAATLTQAGVISLSAQVMGDGDKTFDDNVFAGKRFVATGLSVGAPLGTVYFVDSSGQIGIGNDTGSDAVFFGTVTGGTFKLRLRGASTPTQALCVFSSESGDTFATPAFALSTDGGTTVTRGAAGTFTTVDGKTVTVLGGLIVSIV